MAFEVEPVRTPEGIGSLRVTLLIERDGYKAARYAVEVAMDDGTFVTRKGDLVPHLTQAEIQSLQAFMDDLGAKAEAEILPQQP